MQYNRQVNSTGALIFSIVVAILCGLMSPITLVCSIPAIVFAAMVSHDEMSITWCNAAWQFCIIGIYTMGCLYIQLHVENSAENGSSEQVS